MLTKDPVKETEKALEQEASFGEVVERSIGLSLSLGWALKIAWK